MSRATHTTLATLVVLTSALAGCSLTSKLTGGKNPPPASPAAGASSLPSSPSSGSDALPDGATSAATSGEKAPEPEREHSEGLPPKVVELVRETYGVDPDRPGTEINPRNNYYEALRPAAVAFEAGWKAYEARLAIVTPAVARAAELQKAGKLADARAALEAVITPTTTDAEGKIDPRARKTLDPRDAELPAIEAWIAIVAALGDRKALVEAGHHMWVRRRARDRETEMWFWLSSAADDSMGRLVSQNTPGVRNQIWKIWDEAAKVRGASPFDTEGQRLAGMYFNSLEQFKLSWTTVDVEKGKAGDWVMIRVEPVTIGAREVTHSSTQQWRVPKRCWDGNKVSWWDANGKPVYERECEYTYHSRPITLKAGLGVESPAWSRGRERILVVGRIEKAGPSWKLADAFIPDLRFSETGFLF